MGANLYLFPSLLADVQPQQVLPPYNAEVLARMPLLFVENIKTTRRFLVRLGLKERIDQVEFRILNKKTTEAELIEHLQALLAAGEAGVLSESGAPAVADPGAQLIMLAHQSRITVVPLVGPSSILLGLMASGLNGQNFTFHGYLPIKQFQRRPRIKELEAQSRQEKSTQIFIETPYRNMALLQDIIEVCHPATMLCIAANLTAPNQQVTTLPLNQWKQQKPQLHKIPAVFYLYT